MDYAKYALLKAQELSSQSEQDRPKIYKKGFVFEKNLSKGQTFLICDLLGSGPAGVIVSLGFSDMEQQGSVDFIAGQKLVFSRPLSVSMLFMASLEIDSKISLKIKVSGSAKLLSADIMAIGAKIGGMAESGLKLDAYQGHFAAVYIRDGEVRLSAGSNLPDLSDYVVVGFGTSAAVAILKDQQQIFYAVSFVDTQSNLFFALYDISLTQQAFRFLGKKAQSIGLVSQQNQLILGYQYKGIAYAGILTKPEFELNSPIKLEEAKSIEFVKNSVPPAVILKKDGRSVIRLANPQQPMDDAINVLIEFS